MSYEVNAYLQNKEVRIDPLTIKRDFFDNSDGKAAYRCLPISSANIIGWGISFPEDISFIWDGELNNFQEHVKILSGENYIVPMENKTLSFNSGISLKTGEDLSVFLFPVPNQFSNEWSTMSAVFSTSFYNDEVRPAIVLHKSNQVITIKAGTPVAALIPISLTNLNNSTIKVEDWDNKDFSVYNEDYAKAMEDSRYAPELVSFYRNAWNHKKEKIGKHEVSYLNLKTIGYEE